MANPMLKDLLDQYHRSFKMLYDEFSRFDDQQWTVGLDDPAHFQVPVVLAMHILDCLDFYFCAKPDQYKWGHRFGGYWELPVERLPGKAPIVAYTRELEARVISELSALSDADMALPPLAAGDSGATRIGHYIYALRHTMHHHGELAALAVFHGKEGGAWE